MNEPTRHPGIDKVIRTKPVAGIALQKYLLGLLCKKAHSKKQLCELVGVRHTTICRWLETYHRGPNNLVYISGWKRSITVGPYTAFYSFGYCMPDEPRPRRLTKKEMNQRYARKFRKSNPEEGVTKHVSK